MAISANTVFEVRTGGSDTLNSGGFVTGATGTDYSLQDAAQIALTDSLSTVHSTTTQINVSIAEWTVSAADVGNLLNITGGTATAGLYQITVADVGNNRWTLDRSAGTAAQTVLGGVGGAWASPGKAAAVATVSGNIIYVKTGTFTLSTSTPGAGGPVVFASNVNLKMEGYSATRGDLAAVPTVSAGAVTGITIFTYGGTSGAQEYVNLRADGNSGASNICFGGLANARHSVKKCVAANATTGFVAAGNTGGVVLQSYADTCTTGFSSVFARFCVAKSCTTGFSASAGTLGANSFQCLAYLCATGFAPAAGAGPECTNCTANACTVAGFGMGSAAGGTLTNCLATNCTGGGIYGFNVSATISMWYCAVYNNGTNVNGTPLDQVGTITLTADPYENAAGSDFRPNKIAGGGAEVRGAGVRVYGQTDFNTVGAVSVVGDFFFGGVTKETAVNVAARYPISWRTPVT